MEELTEEITDTIFYFVLGLGCDYDASKERNEINWISNITNIAKSHVKVKCHKSSSALKCIAQTYINRIPLEDSRFVNELVEEITADINKPEIHNVIIFAESFGGAMINRAGEILNTNNDSNINKLNIATFGSIYLAPEKNIQRINILNYLSISDVAFKCNHIQPARLNSMPIYLMLNSHIVCSLPNEDNSKKLIQLCLYKYPKDEPLCKENRISILRWTEHYSYGYLMIVILYNFVISRSQPDLHNYINVYESYKLPEDSLILEDIPYLIGYSSSIEHGGKINKKYKKNKKTIKKKKNKK